MVYCPKCDREMDHVEAEPDVNIIAGWSCEECGVFIHDGDVDDEPE